MGQDQSSCLVDENTPTRTLESRSIEAVAKHIKNGHARKIVVMTGAGISTSAGIPDFRSPDTGLYANLARLNLPYAEAVFSIGYFRDNPLPFYTLAHELYPGNYRPTITHSFVNLLHKKGLLLKLFTQNIDCLEREAGVPDDLIVEAHGSFAKQSCIECKSPYPKELMEKAIRENPAPASIDEVPHCLNQSCNGLVKPEIVFFGEALPAEFFMNKDLPGEADLCIIMGTSLTVHPFASLPEFCADGTPRVLINQEQVGEIGSRADDVLILGDCDTGVRKLSKALGWLEELEEMWAKTAPEGQKGIEKEKEKEKEMSKKTRDEQLQDEVDQITREVEQNLKLREEQFKWLENHVDNKIARVQDEDREAPAKNPATQEQQKEDSSHILSDPKLESRLADSGGGSGLAHVFPFLNKKSSL